ncbi:unnamed protein product, partial [marine sediment metagenome]
NPNKGYSGWMALVLGVGAFVLLLRWPAIKEWWQRRHTWGRLVAVAVGVVLVAAVILASGRVAARVNSYSLYTRLYNWWVSVYQVADHPWFGSGLNVRHVQAQYSARVHWEDTATWLRPVLPYYELSQMGQQRQLINHTHNIFLELAVGAGIPALLAFLWFLWALAKHSLTTFRHATGHARVLIAGCIAGIVASLGWGLIDVMEYSPPFFTTPTWVLVGLLLAAPRTQIADCRLRIADRPSRITHHVSRFTFYVLCFAFILIAIVL